MYSDVRAINELVQRESAFIDPILHEVRKVIVGQDLMVERILIGLLTGGHVLLEGVPGLAKTLTVKTVASTVHAKFSRIQFTPDLLPADVVGTVIYNQQSGQFSAKKGPIFANLVLADEINRAPAKVQSALLEAMQELQVTIGDTTHRLDRPFMVMATQNPIEQEGTYPLPEAQVDRFMMHVRVGYPTRDEERAVMERMADHVLIDPDAGQDGRPDPLAVDQKATTQQLLEARAVVGQVYIDEKIKDYIIDIVAATRAPSKVGLKDLGDMVAHGASPRASIALNVASRAHAFIKHRGYVTPEDIKAVGPDVLRHRIIRTYEAEAEEITSEHIVRRIFEAVEVPEPQANERRAPETTMIPRELIKKLRKIEIHTSRLANDQLAGSYHSVFKGRGMAFSEVRQYQPGDDVRFIDWNVSARMNDVYVKVFTEEREMTVMLLVDLSASERFGSIARPKIEIVAEISALLAFSAIKNNDRVGLILFTDRVERYVPPKKGKGHVMRVVTEILNAQPEGEGTHLAVALDTLGKVTKRRSVAFLVSDFIADDYDKPLRVASARHDLIPIQVVDPREEELPNVGVALLEDLESGELMEVDTSDPGVRRAYFEHVARERGARERRFKRLKMDAVTVRTHQDYVRPIAELFRMRQKRLGGFR